IPISLFDLTATISSSRPKKRLALDRSRAQRPTCWIARFNVANYDDTEGSSPSGASVAPQTCIRSIREDRNHDAVMRIGGEAPRRRAVLRRGSKTKSQVGLPPPP